jgi:hypothetical protein
MRALIDKGHVFIAQPPLYKVKRGKEELYLGNDKELNAYVIRKATEEKDVEIARTAPPSRDRAPHMLQALIEHDQYMTSMERMGIVARGGRGDPRRRCRRPRRLRRSCKPRGAGGSGSERSATRFPPRADEEHGLFQIRVSASSGRRESSTSTSSCGRRSRCASCGRLHPTIADLAKVR